MSDIRFPSVIIVTEEQALVHYDLFTISRVLPTVPKIRLSCIFCTWFPLRRSEDTPVEHPGREPGSTPVRSAGPTPVKFASLLIDMNFTGQAGQAGFS